MHIVSSEAVSSPNDVPGAAGAGGAAGAVKERALASAARAGDADAFEELVRRRTPGVLAFLRRMLGDAEDARDVAQLTFVRVWENLDRYDSSWAFSTWLFRIAGNLAIDALRSRRTRARTESETFRLLRGGRAAGGSVEQEGPLGLERQEVLRVFTACASVLSEKQRLVFVLREIEERESRDIAEILGCRESTVRNHLFQARRLLRDEVRRRFPEFVPQTRKPGGEA
ncbi:MAG TPA: sigma-70 family RNA polymerase sigma factor [Thermoanaerobaculia bacterium]|nr:sigma-70 family RNA polymerase sigma factor [Thermoanaerobaculia bacterium]